MRVPSIVPLAAVASALAVLTLGCGGAVAGSLSGSGDSGAPEGSTHDSGPAPFDAGGDDASSNDGGGHDASPPLSPDCPAALPTAGSACTHENVQCEYGDAWWSVSCDSVVQCQSGVWTPFKPSYEPCSAEPGPNSASCPADFAAVPQGECSMNGLTCVYPQGECSCAVLLGGPVQIDGGVADWGCVPEQGCPFPRPLLGTPCSGEGIDCTYEACSYGETCTNGLWEALEEGCAGAGQGSGG
jgi:hypothetical protein